MRSAKPLAFWTENCDGLSAAALVVSIFTADRSLESLADLFRDRQPRAFVLHVPSDLAGTPRLVLERRHEPPINRFSTVIFLARLTIK
jgi:hypothetical protein